MSILTRERWPQVRLSAKPSAADVQAAAAALSKRGSHAHALVLDVTDSAAVTCAVAEIGDEHGPFQVLVNKVGTNRPKPFDEVIEDDVDALLALNVKAAFFVARAAASGLKAAGLAGSIVHASSQMGHVGAVNRSIYCNTKHALEDMSKTLALALGPLGIRAASRRGCLPPDPRGTRHRAHDPGHRADAALATRRPRGDARSRRGSHAAGCAVVRQAGDTSSVADGAVGCIRFRAVGRVILPVTRPGMVATGLFGGRLTCNGFMPGPARNHACNATMPAETAGVTTPASPMQGAVKV